MPVLPYYLDILRTFDFSKKTKKVSMKPMNFSCILRLSKSQMTENAYKDAVVEQVPTFNAKIFLFECLYLTKSAPLKIAK